MTIINTSITKFEGLRKNYEQRQLEMKLATATATVTAIRNIL